MQQSNDQLRRAYAAKRQARFRERQQSVAASSSPSFSFHNTQNQAVTQRGLNDPHYHSTTRISHLYNDLDHLPVHNTIRTRSNVNNYFGDQLTSHFREYIPSQHSSRRVYNPDFHAPIHSQHFSRRVSNPDVHFVDPYLRATNQMQFQQHSQSHHYQQPQNQQSSHHHGQS